MKGVSCIEVKINDLIYLFNDVKTLKEVSNEMTIHEDEVISIGNSWGYDFIDWSSRNLNKRLAKYSKEELICLIIKTNIL